MCLNLSSAMCKTVYLLAVVIAGSCKCDMLPRDYGLCSQVFQMHAYCSGNNEGVPPVPNNRQNYKGKAGPRGPSGQDAVVDYAAINAKITEKIAEWQAINDARLEKCETEVKNLKTAFIPLFTDCGKVLKEYAITRNVTGGVFDIYTGYKKMRVFCDLTTDDGRWMVFQRRMDGSVDFYTTWNNYVTGFGSETGEFWLGLEALHQLTSSATYELRVDLEDWEGNKRFAKYETFHVGDAASNYRLKIGTYSGNAGDSMNTFEQGSSFTTKDRDSDQDTVNNCAVLYKGAWWYKACHQSNLNGFYFRGGVHTSFADGIEWLSWKGYRYSMKFTEMKMRIVD